MLKIAIVKYFSYLISVKRNKKWEMENEVILCFLMSFHFPFLKLEQAVLYISLFKFWR